MCESLIDALTWVCNGFATVTSTYGAGGLTDEMIEAFKRHNTKTIYLSQDADEAGDSAAMRHSKGLAEIGISSYRVQFPRGMDANEYALKIQPAQKSLEMALEKAVKLAPGQPMSNSEKISPSSPPLSDGHGKKSAEAGEGSNTDTTRAAGPEDTQPQATPQSEETPPQTRSQSSPVVAGFSLRRNEPPSEPETTHPVPSENLSEPPQNPPSPIKPLVEVKDDTIYITLGDRIYRILGLYKNHAREALNINILLKREEKIHQDTFNFASDNKRETFIRKASKKLDLEEEIIISDVDKLVLALDDLLQKHINAQKEPKEEPEYQMTKAEEEEAIAFLKRPDLLEEVARHFELCGIVGEKTNCQALWLGGISRFLQAPLMIMLQSLSGAGKSSLMEALLKMIPEDHKIFLSAMTGKCLYYMDGVFVLSHKILAIAEEKGLEQAVYALKTLQSEGILTIASTGRNPDKGRLEPQFYKVRGPVMIIFTTTNAELDDELLNRCLILLLNITAEQTRAIHQLQRKKRTLEGLKGEKEMEKILKLQQNAQRLLRPVRVVNPYADDLEFLFNRLQTRRDNEKYLTMIEALAFAHQYQKPIKKMKEDGEEILYIEVTLEDIKVANRICNEILGHSLDDMLPQTKLFLDLIYEMVQKECEKQSIDQKFCPFTQRQIREYTGWRGTSVSNHLKRLVELEYVLKHSGKKDAQCLYELFYKGEGKDGRPFMLGLVDIEELAKKHQRHE